MKQKIGRFLKQYWRIGARVLAVVLVSILLFGWRLGSLTTGVSSQEIQSLAQYSSFHAIINNPLHAPLKLVAWAMWHIPLHTAAMLRAPYALFGMLSLVAFAYILRRWYGQRMAVLGVIAFATSSILLHVSRVALFDVSFLWAGVTLVALHLLFYAHSDRWIVRIVWLVGMLALLFVPGMVWLIGANLILQREDLMDTWADMHKLGEKILYPLVVIMVLAGVGLLIYRQPHLGLEWLGAPAAWRDWHGMLIRLYHADAYFVLRGPHQPALWLDRLPLLDAFGTIMLIAGVLFYARHLRSFRTKLIAVFAIIEVLLFAVSSTISISLLVPLVYAIIIGGLAFVLHQWLRVFPRNPLARSLGIVLVTLLVIASSTYNLRSYFIAWPHNSETRATFTSVIPGM